MEDGYIKTKEIPKAITETKEEELIKSIIKTKTELASAIKNFEYAEDELIDFYAYQIKANQAKLNYLIKKVKEKGMALDMIDAIKFEGVS
jgi:hypothetical protein